LQENLQLQQKVQKRNETIALNNETQNQTKATQTFDGANSSDSVSTLKKFESGQVQHKKKIAIKRDADTSFASLTGSFISDAINLEPEEKVI
jgi:hypothetical protein